MNIAFLGNFSKDIFNIVNIKWVGVCFISYFILKYVYKYI